MRSKKIPADAFEYFAGLGADRSFEAAAQKYDVSRQAIAKLAKKERWQGRVAKIDREVQKGTDEKITEGLEEMNRRHLQVLQIVQRKALETLRAMPLSTAMEAVRAIEMSINRERTIRGEPSNRTAINLEGLLRQQCENWFTPEPNGREEVENGNPDD